MILDLYKIQNATKDLHTKLTDGLEDICDENGWMVLAKSEIACYLCESSPTDILEMEGAICPYNTCKDKEGKEIFRCACGKKKIQRLSFIEVEGQPFRYIIIGSCCIVKVAKFLKKIEGVEDLLEKLEIWIEYIKEEEEKTTKKPCLACGKHKISKTTKYKKLQRKYWCNDCSSGGSVKCITCNEFRVFQLDYLGKPMKYCRTCFFTPISPVPSSV